LERYWRSTRGLGVDSVECLSISCESNETEEERANSAFRVSVVYTHSQRHFSTKNAHPIIIFFQDSVTHHIPTDTTTIYFKLLNRNTVPICTKDGLTNTIQSTLDNEKFLVYYCHWHIQKPPTFTKFFFFTTSDTGTQSSLNSSCPYSLQRAARHFSASR
jgi:hypothetical protein